MKGVSINLCSQTWEIWLCCNLPAGASAGAPKRQSNDFSGLGDASSGSGSVGGLPQGLAASMGMNSSSSMSDPLGWLGPSDARNTGKWPLLPE